MPSTLPSPFDSILAAYNKGSLRLTLFWAPVLLLGAAALWALNEMVLSKLSVPQLLLWQAKNHVVAIAIAVLLVHIVGKTVSALNQCQALQHTYSKALRDAYSNEGTVSPGHAPIPRNWSLRAPLLTLLALVAVQAITAMALFGSEHPYIAVECSSTILSTKISFCDGANSIAKASVDMLYVKVSALAAVVLPCTRIYLLFLSVAVSEKLPRSSPWTLFMGGYLRERFDEMHSLYHPSLILPHQQRKLTHSPAESAKADA